MRVGGELLYNKFTILLFRMKKSTIFVRYGPTINYGRSEYLSRKFTRIAGKSKKRLENLVLKSLMESRKKVKRLTK